MKKKAILFGIPVLLIIMIGGLYAYSSVTPITSCEPIGDADVTQTNLFLAEFETEQAR